MGEVWIFHLENGQPAGTHLVSPDTKPAPNELMVKMTPNNGTTLVVTNNTDKFLNYHAAIIGKDREEPTSVCTLMSGGRSGFENWGGRIPAIRLGDFQSAKDNTMVCR